MYRALEESAVAKAAFALITRLYVCRAIGDRIFHRIYRVVMKVSRAPASRSPTRLTVKAEHRRVLMIGSVIGAVLLLVYALWYMQISNATRDGLKRPRWRWRAPWPICRR